MKSIPYPVGAISSQDDNLGSAKGPTLQEDLFALNSSLFHILSV